MIASLYNTFPNLSKELCCGRTKNLGRHIQSFPSKMLPNSMSHDQPRQMHYFFKEIYGNFECIPQVGMKMKNIYIYIYIGCHHLVLFDPPQIWVIYIMTPFFSLRQGHGVIFERRVSISLCSKLQQTSVSVFFCRLPEFQGLERECQSPEKNCSQSCKTTKSKGECILVFDPIRIPKVGGFSTLNGKKKDRSIGHEFPSIYRIDSTLTQNLWLPAPLQGRNFSLGGGPQNKNA